MSLYTLDLQIPRTFSGQIPELLNGSANQVLSWSLLYSDPQSAYYRIELFEEEAETAELEKKILAGCPEARIKIKDEMLSVADTLVAVAPSRSLDFRKAFHRTSQQMVSDAASRFLSRKHDLRGLPLIKDRLLFLSDGRALPIPGQSLFYLERDAFLACKFADVHALPLFADSRNEEEFLKTAQSLTGGVSAIRISLLGKQESLGIMDRLTEQCEIPLIHAEYLETSATMAAIVRNAVRFHKMELAGKSVAIVGINPASQGLMHILQRSNCGKIYGVDAEYSHVSRFEKEGGIATSFDFVAERADIIIISPGTQITVDFRKVPKDQVILAFGSQISDEAPSAEQRVHFCEDPHPIYSLPGLILGIHKFGIDHPSIELSVRLSDVLVEKCGDGRFLPIPTEALISAQADALKAFGKTQLQ